MPWHWTQLVRCRSAAFVVACGDANHNYLPSQGVWSGRNATASLTSRHHLITCLAIIYVIMRHRFWLMNWSELGDYDSLKIAGLRRAEVGQTSLRLLARWRLQREWQFVNIFSRMPSSFSPQSYWWTTSIGRSSCTPTSSAWYRT